MFPSKSSSKLGAGRLTLQLYFILDNQGVVGVVDLVGELSGNGVVSSLVLDHKTLLALHSLEDIRLLNSPLANICPLLIGAGRLFLGMGGLPSLLPAIGELLDECIGFQSSRL